MSPKYYDLNTKQTPNEKISLLQVYEKPILTDSADPLCFFKWNLPLLSVALCARKIQDLLVRRELWLLRDLVQLPERTSFIFLCLKP